MALGVKLIFFTLLLNICAGMLALALAPIMPDGLGIGINYDASRNVNVDTWKGSVTTPGVDPSSGWWIKFLDFISMGFYTKIQALLDSTIFGIPELFTSMGIIPMGFQGYFNLIISLIYIIALVEIFTNKRLT